MARINLVIDHREARTAICQDSVALGAEEGVPVDFGVECLGVLFKRDLMDLLRGISSGEVSTERC